jgi:hypothetical protein
LAEELAAGYWGTVESCSRLQVKKKLLQHERFKSYDFFLSNDIYLNHKSENKSTIVRFLLSSAYETEREGG